MICVASYTGHEAHTMARQLVTELRGPNFKLAAYVFNHGAEARKKERERVQEVLKKQREALQHQQAAPEPSKDALTLIQRASVGWDPKRQGDPNRATLQVRHMRVEEQVAVLVGSYRNMDAARSSLDELRKLKGPDPERVKLHSMWIMRRGEKPGEVKGEQVFVNPFLQGFVVRNPAAPKEQVQEEQKWDLPQLRRLNADEPLSLLNCRGQYTLAVKMLQVPTRVQSKDSAANLWNKMPAVTTNSVDPAGESAHNLAEFFRKGGLESYVLHMRYLSVVTVGSFDRLDDPRLRLLQERLSQLSANPAYAPLGLEANPRPMVVPR
jgi:hypothetical protein